MRSNRAFQPVKHSHRLHAVQPYFSRLTHVKADCACGSLGSTTA